MALARSVWRLLLTGLIFHLVYIWSVIDCYFTSPVVNGMQQHSLGTGEAKRLALIVGDGLRADLLFMKNGFTMVPDSPEVVAPHLRSIVETRGAFGISHTRVPTESRVGHVALIGGMYEDVSAVTKGWKANPVNFDSVFNQSSSTFSFGSPDILPLFARGATPGRVEMWSYDDDAEDFTKDATALDVWVLDQLRTLFHNATTDPVLDARLRADKTVFFLHLLGLDTTGHSYRPHSREYMANIQVVDEIVKQTEELFHEFFRDEETAFVFTADHGMSKIGNHGDGDPDNTRTPLIAWGKGVRGPLPDSHPSSHNDYSEPFELNHLLRRDVDQADVANLMAALVGVNWPINSVGVLPDIDPTLPGYMLPRDGEKTQAEAALINAKVLLEHYRVKHLSKQDHHLFYRPFSYFADVQTSAAETLPGESEIAAIEALISDKNYSQARLRAKEFVAHTLAGLRYLETYDRTLLQGIVIAAYLGWIAFGAVSILLPTHDTNSEQPAFHVVAASVLILFWAVFVKQRSPPTYYVYIVFPCYFWGQVLARASTPLLQYVRGGQPGSLARHMLRGTLVVAALQSMVAGYTHRTIWSVWFAVVGLLWPLVSWPSEVRSRHWALLLGWAASCLGTAIFPLLSLSQEENLIGITAGAALMYGIGLLGLGRFQYADPQESGIFKGLIFFTINTIGWSVLFVNFIVRNLRDKEPVPPVHRLVGWALFLISPVLPFILRVGPSNPQARLLGFFLAFGTFFVWLAIAYEGLFYISYTLTLCLWVEIETVLRAHAHPKSVPTQNTETEDLSTYRPKADDLRIAVFFLLFVQAAFFGTGNVASISSFYLEPVYRLVPVFNPFLMSTLLILKIVCPYVMLAISFSILNARLNLPPFSLFLVALSLTDIMTITFFLNVTDTGSWLEIGQTISFFCISSLLLVWSAGICVLGEVLMAGQPRGIAASPEAKKVE